MSHEVGYLVPTILLSGSCNECKIYIHVLVNRLYINDIVTIHIVALELTGEQKPVVAEEHKSTG